MDSSCDRSSGEKFSGVNFYEVATKMRNSITIRSGFIRNAECTRWFFATDAVKWLLNSELCEDVADAEYFGNLLVESGYIYRADDSVSGLFQNRFIAYRFSFDDVCMKTLLGQEKMDSIALSFADEMVNREVYVGMKKVKKAAYGADIVLWLCQMGYAKNRGEACSIADYLIENGALYVLSKKQKWTRWIATTPLHVKGFKVMYQHQPFQDGDEIYRLSPEFEDQFQFPSPFGNDFNENSSNTWSSSSSFTSEDELGFFAYYQ